MERTAVLHEAWARHRGGKTPPANTIHLSHPRPAHPLAEMCPMRESIAMYILRALSALTLPPRAYLLTHAPPSSFTFLISGPRLLSYTSCHDSGCTHHPLVVHVLSRQWVHASPSCRTRPVATVGARITALPYTSCRDSGCTHHRLGIRVRCLRWWRLGTRSIIITARVLSWHVRREGARRAVWGAGGIRQSQSPRAAACVK